MDLLVARESLGLLASEAEVINERGARTRSDIDVGMNDRVARQSDWHNSIDSTGCLIT